MNRIVNVALPLAGLAFSLVWVALSTRPAPAATPRKESAAGDFPRTIAASGIIESSSRNIAVMPVNSGKVTAVLVREGQSVRRHQPLYLLDDSDLQAQLVQAEAAAAQASAALATAQAQLVQAHAGVAAAESNQRALEATSADLGTQARANADLFKQGIVSFIANNTSARAAENAQRRVVEAQQQTQEAEDQIRVVETQTDQARAGVGSSQGRITQLRIEIEQMRVRAPIDGLVLQVNSFPGESVIPGQATAPVLLGNTRTLEVRVDIDETSAADFRPGRPAVAHLRGNSQESFPLTYDRVEPYVVPRTQLTGDDTERVDVRVLQVLYRFQPPPFPVYVGQQVDVYIAR